MSNFQKLNGKNFHKNLSNTGASFRIKEKGPKTSRNLKIRTTRDKMRPEYKIGQSMKGKNDLVTSTAIFPHSKYKLGRKQKKNSLSNLKNWNQSNLKFSNVK